MNHSYSAVISLLLLFIGVQITQGQSFLTKNIKAHIQKHSIKNQRNWNENKYVLYTAQGNNHLRGFKNTRTIIIDKYTGKARLEVKSLKNESLVCLFNFNEQKIEKIGINKKKIPHNESLEKLILEQFNEDIKLLFLPIFLSQTNAEIVYLAQQVLNANVIHKYKLTHARLFNQDILQGEFHINNNGSILYFSDNTNKYSVHDIKDIGSGIEIPTKYQHRDIPSKSCNFITVAAFMDVEAAKFELL